MSERVSVPGFVVPAPRLRFDAAIPSRAGAQSYQGVAAHGPFDSSKVSLGDGTLLFVFPQAHHELAHRLAKAWLSGVGNFKGFEKMFRVPVATGQALRSLAVQTDLSDPSAAAVAYRKAIADWAAEPREQDPRLALVLVPHSEPWQTDRPYYEAKAAFANLGVPSQMVTLELVNDERQFQWSAANIALASFAKLGGVPWIVEAPAEDEDLIIGIGRREVGREGNRRRIFGYAVTFVSNGMYRQTWSFTPAADQDTYIARLGQSVEAALRADLDSRPPGQPDRLARDRDRPASDEPRRSDPAGRLSAPGRLDAVGQRRRGRGHLGRTEGPRRPAWRAASAASRRGTRRDGSAGGATTHRA